MTDTVFDPDTLSDDDLGQALLRNASRHRRVRHEWDALTSPQHLGRSKEVLIQMKNANLAAIDRRKADLELERETRTGTSDEDWDATAREFAEWHRRAKNFARHTDAALHALRTASAVSELTGAAWRLLIAVKRVTEEWDAEDIELSDAEQELQKVEREVSEVLRRLC